MGETLGRRLSTAEDWLLYQNGPCGIYGGQSVTGSGFPPSLPFSPVSINLPLLHIHSCVIWRTESGPVRGRSFTVI
jgi:hypothetical protein